MRPIIFINSHPIQYFAPLYKYLNEHGLRTKAWYCTDASLRKMFDKQFGVEIKWDIPLLEGYEYQFFKNNSWKPSHFNGFWGLINLDLIRKLLKEPPSVIVVHGWHYFTLFMVIMIAKAKGHVLCLRCDVPYSHEVLKRGWKQKIKNFALRNVMFPRISKFLHIGTQNKLFYQSLGVANKDLISCPYAVDNQRFRQQYDKLKNHRAELKNLFGIPDDNKVIVFTAKYIEKKRPLDILAAFKALNMDDLWLVMVGEGEFREQMERFVNNNNIKNTIFTGFINQSKIAEYYCIADVFVMASALGENWGLSVNEAMNFNLPLVLSDLTGSSVDLVEVGGNGYIFQTGNIDDLTIKLRAVLYEKKLTWRRSSHNIIDDFSFDKINQSLKNLAS